MAQNPTSSNLLNVLGVLVCEDDANQLTDCRESLACSVTEMAIVYGTRFPYLTIPTIQGDCGTFTDDFIYLVRYAMSTDCLLYMSSDERAMWDQFVAYQDTGISNFIDGVESLDSYLVDLVNCIDPLSGCKGSCDGGYLVKVPNDKCSLSIIPPQGN